MLYLARIDFCLPQINPEYFMKKLLKQCFIFDDLLYQLITHFREMIKLLLIIFDESFFFELTERDTTASCSYIHMSSDIG